LTPHRSRIMVEWGALFVSKRFFNVVLNPQNFISLR
jgi:hypothetical protein